MRRRVAASGFPFPPSPTAPPCSSSPDTVPVGSTDINPANNTATDTDTLTPQADLSITFDHRILDGMTAAKFVLDVVRLLEHPAVLALES